MRRREFIAGLGGTAAWPVCRAATLAVPTGRVMTKRYSRRGRC